MKGLKGFVLYHIASTEWTSRRAQGRLLERGKSAAGHTPMFLSPNNSPNPRKYCKYQETCPSQVTVSQA